MIYIFVSLKDKEMKEKEKSPNGGRQGECDALPCLNLDAEQKACTVGRAFPADCQTCAAYVPAIADADRTRCEIWTRVMGYHRPVSAFNAGKQSEHRDRLHFSESAARAAINEEPAA